MFLQVPSWRPPSCRPMYLVVSPPWKRRGAYRESATGVRPAKASHANGDSRVFFRRFVAAAATQLILLLLLLPRLLLLFPSWSFFRPWILPGSARRSGVGKPRYRARIARLETSLAGPPRKRCSLGGRSASLASLPHEICSWTRSDSNPAEPAFLLHQPGPSYFVCVISSYRASNQSERSSALASSAPSPLPPRCLRNSQLI